MFEVRPEQTGFIFLLGKHAAFDFFGRSEQPFFFFCYIVLISFTLRSLTLILSAVSGFYVFAVFIACLNGVLLINISILYHVCNMRLYIVVDFGYCPVVIRGQSFPG